MPVREVTALALPADVPAATNHPLLLVASAMTTAKNVSMVSIALAITASVRVAPAGPLLDADAKKTVKSVIRETVIANNATA